MVLLKIYDKRTGSEKVFQPVEPGSRLWNKYFCLIIAMSSAVNFANFFVGSSFSLWIVDMGGTNTAYGTIHGLYSFIVLLARPVTGWIIDHGNRKRAFILSTLVFASAMVLMLISPIFGLFIAMRLLQGAGTGCAATICSSSAYDYIPPDKLEKGIGYIALSSSLISALTATFSVGTYNRSGPVPLVVWSVIALAVAIALSMLIVFRSPSEVKKFRIKEVFNFNQLFEKRSLKPAIISALSVNLAFGMRGYIILYGRSLGFANPGLYTLVSSIGLIIVRLVQDAMPNTEKTPRRRIYFSFAVFIIYCVVIGLCRNLVMYFGAALLWAVLYGVLNPQLQSIAIKAAPIERRGAASGTFYCSADIGIILGSTVGGILADAIGYSSMFFCAIIPAVLCIIFYAVFMDGKPTGSTGSVEIKK